MSTVLDPKHASMLLQEGACIANEDKRIVGLGYLELQYEETKGGKARRRLGM